MLLNPRIVAPIIKFLFLVEPLIPVLASIAIRLEFLRLRKAGYLVTYEINIGRLSMYYYEFNVHLVMNSGKALQALASRISQFLG